MSAAGTTRAKKRRRIPQKTRSRRTAIPRLLEAFRGGSAVPCHGQLMTAKLMSEAAKGLQFKEPPIFERGSPGRSAASVAALDVPEVDVAHELGALSRQVPAGFPEVSEPEAIRHFVRLSQWNFSIDTQFYPLGSCTMKHNPKVNEWAARLDGFANLHPLTPDHLAQGALELMVRLAAILA